MHLSSPHLTFLRFSVLLLVPRALCTLCVCSPYHYRTPIVSLSLPYSLLSDQFAIGRPLHSVFSSPISTLSALAPTQSSLGAGPGGISYSALQAVFEQLSQTHNANGIAGLIAQEASQNATNGYQEVLTNGINGMPSPPRSISPCSEIQRLKKEVAEIKMIVYQLLLAPTQQQQAAGLQALLGGHAGGSGGMGDSIMSPLHNNNNGHTNGRKRSANFGNGGGPTQPEQPVALRPAIGNCSMSNGGSSFMPQWNTTTPWTIFNSLRNTSPTLPGAAPTTETASAGDGQKLWSSPSSVESGLKPESNAGDSNIDPVGMESDGSPTSSTCTQSPADVLAFAAAQIPAMPHPNGVHERKPRKQISDDYVKLIRQQHELSGKNISDIQIPVPEALECDPSFVATPEKQIVEQIIQSKKFDELSPKDVQEATTQLCKKLAEKRVFGPRLMAQTTVAGPNHSTYNNLPDEGIIYIQHVCRTVLKDKLKNEEEFWDVFREAMRKLAARCRRVRHAKKTKSMKENGMTPLIESQTLNALSFLAGGNTEQWLENVKKNVAKHEDGMSPPSSLAAALFTQSVAVKSESPEEPVTSTSTIVDQLVPNMKMEDIAEWVKNQMNNAAATSPVHPLHNEISATLAKAMPGLTHVFQGASA